MSSAGVPKVILAALVLSLLALSFMEQTEAGYSSVDILNWSIGAPLWVHCQSRDDDLGWQLLQIHQDWRFQFHQNFQETTTFWCRFEWGPHRQFWQAFEVWDHQYPQNMPVTCGNCLWRAESGGMYIWDKFHQEFDFWRSWNHGHEATASVESNSTQAPWQVEAAQNSSNSDLPEK